MPLPSSEPEKIDEEKAHHLQKVVSEAALRAKPFGEEKCASCRYYLDPDAGLAYCWQPDLRILVDAQWWCQWWEQDA